MCLTQEMMLHWHIFQYMNEDNLQTMLGLVLRDINYIQESFTELKVCIARRLPSMLTSIVRATCS